MPPVAEVFYQTTLAQASGKESLRTKREMHTLAVIMDHLALGRYKEAADTAGQRMKALELASRTGSWKMAAEVELIPQDTNLTLVGDQEVEMAGKNAKKKDEMDTCLSSRPSSSRPEESLKDRPKRWENSNNYEWVLNDKGKG